MNSQKYFVDAKLDNATVEQLRKQSARQPGFDDQAALKALLSDRFKLAFHMEGRTLPVYDLVVASEGPKLKESKTPRMIRVERGELTSSGIPIALLADELSRRLGQTVVDKTGLKSNYTFSLHWTPDANEDARLRDLAGPGPGTPGPEVSGPPIFIALQEQLGLKLEPDTETVQMLVIDHAEPPTEDQ